MENHGGSSLTNKQMRITWKRQGIELDKMGKRTIEVSGIGFKSFKLKVKLAKARISSCSSRHPNLEVHGIGEHDMFPDIDPL